MWRFRSSRCLNLSMAFKVSDVARLFNLVSGGWELRASGVEHRALMVSVASGTLAHQYQPRGSCAHVRKTFSALNSNGKPSP